MSLQEKAERAKMLCHLQESFLQMTLQEYPKLNFFDVASKWEGGYSAEFSPNIIVSSDYQFYGYDDQVLTLLTKLFANLNHSTFLKEIEEAVRGYINCDVYLERNVEREINVHRLQVE
jgi:hypothetical protein